MSETAVIAGRTYTIVELDDGGVHLCIPMRIEYAGPESVYSVESPEQERIVHAAFERLGVTYPPYYPGVYRLASTAVAMRVLDEVRALTGSAPV